MTPVATFEMKSAIQSVIATLELTGSEHSDLLDFQVDVLFNSAWRFAMIDLAALFDVEDGRVGVAVYQACLDLAKLERRRGWRHPADVVDSPNLAALRHLCQARAARVQGISRRRRLEGISRKLEKLHQHADAKDLLDRLMGGSFPKGPGTGTRTRTEAGPGSEQK